MAIIYNAFHAHSSQGYNQMVIIPVGSTTVRVREIVATRNYLGEQHREVLHETW